MSRLIMVDFAFFVLELRSFDYVLCLFFLEYSITHSLFMISTCNFIGKCFR